MRQSPLLVKADGMPNWLTTTLAWLRKNLLLLVILGTFADFLVFGGQGFQIHILNSQAAQLQSQQSQLNIVSRKSDCWSHVLDVAINKAPLTKKAKDALTAEAKRCARLPG